MATLDFFVPGLPVPQGSKRHVGGGVMVEASRQLAPWRATVAQVAMFAARDQLWERASLGVRLNVLFLFPRPKAHYRTGKHADELRADAPTDHIKVPDADKLIRAVCDALTVAGVWRDDSQACEITAVKKYTDSAVGAQITLEAKE